MRLIGTLDKEPEAHRFTAHLVTEGIQAHAEFDSDSWAIWVRDENRIHEAKDALDDFRRDPDASVYQGAERAAEALLREETRRNEQAQRNVVTMRGKWKSGGAGRKKPLILTLIVISVVVAMGSNMGGDKQGSVLRTLMFRDVQNLNKPNVDWNTLDAKLINIKQGELWRTITPIFIHFGPMHLIFNMIMVYQLGSLVEDRRGTVRMALMVLTIAIVSNLFQALVPQDWGGGVYFGGMSGVLYGIFGYLFIKSRWEPELGMRIPQSTVVILILWMLLGFSGVLDELIGGNIANWAHGIGFITGVVIAAVPLALQSK
jgi:GlpG protein